MTRAERHAELYRVLSGAALPQGGDVAPATRRAAEEMCAARGLTLTRLERGADGVVEVTVMEPLREVVVTVVGAEEQETP